MSSESSREMAHVQQIAVQLHGGGRGSIHACAIGRHSRFHPRHVQGEAIVAFLKGATLDRICTANQDSGSKAATSFQRGLPDW